jgi:hypothetical protein
LFLFKKIREQNTDLSNELLDVLKKRFVERRNKDLVSLMRYLQNPTFPRAEKDDEISFSSKTAIISSAKKILQINFSSDFAPSKTSTQSTETVPVKATVGNTTNESSSTSTEKMDLATELHSSIASVMVRGPMKNSADQFPLIKTEFEFFEKSGTRSPNLDKLFFSA